MFFSELCMPAMIYFVISIIALIFSFFNSMNVMSVIIKGGFIIFWSWVLHYLCKKGFSMLSWILLILPLLMFSFYPF